MHSFTKICAQCKKEFLIIPQERKFYDRKKLPMPVNCHECRRKRRQSLRNSRKLFKRKCGKCGLELMSTYSPDSPYIIYCDGCYLKNVH